MTTGGGESASGADAELIRDTGWSNPHMSRARALRSTRIDGAAARPIILKSLQDPEARQQVLTGESVHNTLEVRFGCLRCAVQAEGRTTTLEHAIAFALGECLLLCQGPQKRDAVLRSHPQSSAKGHDTVRRATTRIKTGGSRTIVSSNYINTGGMGGITIYRVDGTSNA